MYTQTIGCVILTVVAVLITCCTIWVFSYDVFEDGEIKHNGIDFNGSFFSGDSV